MSALSKQQESHPDKKPGEVFRGYFTKVAFDEMPYASKRCGETPDPPHLSPDCQGFPVFVERNEIEAYRRQLYFGSRQLTLASSCP